MSDRDTQFQGFARLLWDELETAIRDTGGFIPEGKLMRRNFLSMMQGVIAQRAYDLACHIAMQTIHTAHGDMSKIPDLTVWPEGKEQDACE